MAEFVVSGVKYKCGKMDLFTQTNVIRRLAPFLGSFKEIAGAANAAASDDLFAAMEPLLKAAASMRDEDMAFIMQACLNVVVREEAATGQWQKVWNVQAKAVQYDDMNDLLIAWSVIGNVLGDNLSGFLNALPTG